ncbi:MAG TPA: HEAT repeat domain-containing protein [Myxococcales bacterium]|jgi:HEAT repeat protein
MTTVATLLSDLSSPDAAKARSAADELASRAKDPEQVGSMHQPLLALARQAGATPQARAFAAIQLPKLADFDEVEDDFWKIVGALASDSRALLRRAAAQAVNNLDAFGPDIDRFFEPLLGDPDPAVRLEAALGMASQRNPKGQRLLYERLQVRGPGSPVFPFPPRDDRHTCLAALLVNEFPEMIAPARAIYEDPTESAQTRMLAAAVMASGGDETGKSVLLEAIEDPNTEAREVALDCIGRIDLEQGIEAMVGMLGDRDDPLRGLAAQILGDCGLSEAVDPLQAMLADESELAENRRKAAKALAELDDDDAWAALQRARPQLGDPALQTLVGELLAEHLEEELE